MHLWACLSGILPTVLIFIAPQSAESLLSGHTFCAIYLVPSACGYQQKKSKLTSHQSFHHSLTHKWCLTVQKSFAKLPPLSFCRVSQHINPTPHSKPWLVLHPMVPSPLCLRCMSDREIFKQSDITKLLTAHMAIMVDKGFLVDTLVPCKVYRPACQGTRTFVGRSGRMFSRCSLLPTWETMLSGVSGGLRRTNSLTSNTAISVWKHWSAVQCGLLPGKLPEWTTGEGMGR